VSFSVESLLFFDADLYGFYDFRYSYRGMTIIRISVFRRRRPAVFLTLIFMVFMILAARRGALGMTIIRISVFQRRRPAVFFDADLYGFYDFRYS